MCDSEIIFYIKENKNYKKDYSISTLNQVFNIIQIKQNEIAYSTENKKVIFFDIISFESLQKKEKNKFPFE